MSKFINIRYLRWLTINNLNLERCQDIDEKFTTRKTPKSYVFVSHPWGSVEHPNPSGTHIRRIRSYLSRNHIAWFWYDFCSIPQSPRSDVEYLIFRQGLAQTTRLILNSKFMMIRNENSSHRAWLVTEKFIFEASCKIKHVPTLDENSFNLCGLNTEEVYEYFVDNGIRSTNGDDMEKLCNIIDVINETYRLKFNFCNAVCFAIAVILITLPLLILNTIIMLPIFLMDRNLRNFKMIKRHYCHFWFSTLKGAHMGEGILSRLPDMVEERLSSMEIDVI